MAVLFITHKYPPSTGGMEQQSYQLITGYQALHKAYSIIYKGEESITMFFIKLRYRVNKMLKANPEITTIHFNDGLMAAFFILLKVSPKGRKCVVTMHGLDVVFPLKLYQKFILPQIAEKMDAIIAVSTATKDACIEREFPIEKIHVIHNGVTLSSFESVDDDQNKIDGIDFEKDKILLAIGRPVKRKGFSWFSEEVMHLLDPNFKFIHIGKINTKLPIFYPFLPKRLTSIYDLFTGRANDTIDLLVAAKKSNNRTIIAGHLSDEQRDSLIKRANLVVMPNKKIAGDMEGFGLVALEAAILGKTVLVSDIEGMQDAIIHGKNGYRVMAGNAMIWTKSIYNLIGNADLTEKDIREFTIQNYSWEKMVLGYKDVFERIHK